ncbi:O-antigen ligase domain-containing protein [Scytonema sp. UIC 10036]|nr:O-antigen ligase domain-containing protein [Scytonema sp. UIC 10036]
MFNLSSSKPKPLQTNFKLNNLSFAERVLYWTIVLTPVWWLLGLQTLLYPTVATILLATNFDLDKLIKRSIPLCNWAWLGMVLVALWTSIQGLSQIGFEVMKTIATLVTLFKGYFLIFSCLTLPFWHRIRVQVVTRAVAWMAACFLITLGIQLLILIAVGPQLPFLPPLARVIPGDKMSLMVGFAIIQPFFGIPLARTGLYTPDPPILGVCALLSFLISYSETDRRLRKFAMAGSLATLIISQSRLAWICFPLSFLIMNGFRSGLVRQSSLWATSFISFICGLVGMTLTELLTKPLETFNSARADSSKDREYVIDATIEAWKESPWIGWGIVERTVTWGNGAFELPLGTFSSYSQVLYLHGSIGFIFFIAALALTLGCFWQPALQGNKICSLAFASLIVLYILCQATTLTWMTIYFWYFFIWLGAILAETRHNYVSSWEQLSKKYKI